ncbi:MAG TPA: hypothetical protein VMI52_13755 [Acetobacteraceae bacterium]|nr:hypothetical protein [Acetobacteraceae bacterium]
MHRMLRAGAALAVLALPARAQAQSSYFMPDGLSRSQAVTLHCAAGNGAVPCGTAANPLSVTAAPYGGMMISRSLTVAAVTSTQLFPANTQRHYLSFQAPQSTGIWVNRVGGTAGPNLPDCAYFPAGTLFESGNFVNTGAITVYAPVSVTISAWEG